MTHLLGDFTSEDARNRMERAARDGGYHLEEWLTPCANGEDMRVAATMRVKGVKHGLGFRWDGLDFNALLARCMALDLSMRQLPEAVAKGKGAPWLEVH